MPDFDALRNRVAGSARHWRRWAKARGIECYRVYDRDIPQFPLVADRYGQHVHLQEFDTGWQLDAGERDAWELNVRAVVAEALDVDGAAIHYKRRSRQRGTTQYTRRETGTDAGGLVVHEGGLRFLVDLDRYIDTGLFLDHRKTRDYVRTRAAGLRLLNLFAYTGAFTVYAAAAGARTTSVDLSNTYLAWTSRNLDVNGLAGAMHALVRADAREFLRDARERGTAFDVVVLDPPSFSNSARMPDTFDVARDHEALIDDAMAIVAGGGELLFSTNRRQFVLAPGLGERYACEFLPWTVPEDFRRHVPHRAWRIKSRGRPRA